MSAEPKFDHSIEALMKRFGLPEDETRSVRGYAIRIVAKALTVQPFSMPHSIGPAVQGVVEEDDIEGGSLGEGIAFDPEFRNAVFGTVTGLALALSTEPSA